LHDPWNLKLRFALLGHGGSETMIRVTLIGPEGRIELDHGEGPLEFGRGPQRDVPRQVLADQYVSRNHLRVEEICPGTILAENLGARTPIVLDDGSVIDVEAGRRLDLPVCLNLGRTEIRITAGNPSLSGIAGESQASNRTPIAPGRTPFQVMDTLTELGDTPDVETLTHWFQTIASVQQAAADSEEFYHQTARAVIDLVGLDRGLVLLKKEEDWQVAAMHAVDRYAGPSFSRGILDEVVRRRRTFYQNLPAASVRESLVNVEAVVAAPVLDKNQEVIAVVYGSRGLGTSPEGGVIRPLEAQIVQVLAAAVGAGLARQEKQAEAEACQIRFAQFFSERLARALENDPHLLEGRLREVTILFSDVRNYSRISEQLGPRETVRLMQDVMELQSAAVGQLDGVVVDYYGDGLLAMWNAPTDQPDHADRACRAALAALEGMPSLAQTWNERLDTPLSLGIGLNTGTALVGNTGSRVKIKYGPMGQTVNLASRVETATKQLGVPIVITGTTRAQLADSFATRRLGRARLAGVAQPVDLYELHSAASSTQWSARRDTFETALEHFESRRWAEACQVLYPLLLEGGGNYDMPSLHLISRAVECLKTMPAQFDPVMDLSKK
jgi:adenylate cyclase